MAIVCQFALRQDDTGYRVIFTHAGSETKESIFDADLSADSRIWEVHDNIRGNKGNVYDALRDIGSQLWNGLIAGEVTAAFQQLADSANGEIIHLRLDLPPEVAVLPWESLYNEREEGFLATSQNFVIIRDPSSHIRVRALPERESGSLRILVAIPQGSGLNVELEWHNISTSLSRLGDNAKVDRLDGIITPDVLSESISAGDYDVFHFIGHGRSDEDGNVQIRLNAESGVNREHWIDGETFATNFQGSNIRLVVLNSCQSGEISPDRSLSGLGPYLMRKGVPAIVAMQYEVPDDVSIKFADAFYRALISAEHAGECWYAVNRARLTVRNNQKQSTSRGFVTPVLYLAPNSEKLFELDLKAHAPEPAPPVHRQEITLPEDFVESFQHGKCIPIVGSGVLKVGAMRYQAVPGPVELAELLAEDSGYPNKETDFGLVRTAGVAGEWMESLLLQWVCQHYLYGSTKKPYQLYEQVRNLYNNIDVPEGLKQVANWKVPGMFYCQCDGLLEEALSDRNVNVLNRVTSQTPGENDGMLLVNLRGSWTDNSLILTENDHDQLSDDLLQMNSHVRDLIDKEYGRSFLIFGVHPRDPLVRQLCTHMLTETNKRMRGDVYFVCRNHTDVDDSYWRQFRTQWIDMELEDFIAQATALLQ